MDIQQLKNFLDLAETLSFRQTAQACFITQPALTRQIQLLENQLDAQLFERTTKQVKLTIAGVYFQKEIKRLLNNFDDIQKQCAAIDKGSAGVIRLAFSTSATQFLMPQILKNIKTNMPKLNTTITDISNHDMVASIKNRAIDVAFGPNILAPSEIESRVVYSENFVLLLPKGSKIKLEKPSDFKKLKNEKFILPSPMMSMGYLESIVRICTEFGNFKPNVVHESPYSTTVMRLVEAGLGISLEPKSSLLGQQMDIQTIELDFIPQKSNMTMLWLEERKREFERFFECVNI